MTDNINTFREGAGGLYNNRDRAKANQDNFIN
jgi:hypothetical protein